MKKIYLAVFLACSMGGAVQAQISEGGLPWSMGMSKETSVIGSNKVSLQQPDYSALQKQDLEDGISGAAKPYRVASIVPADISLSNSGTWTYLENGDKIWNLSIEIKDAQAINFYYDQFNLPVGVKFFITNYNSRQIIGGFSAYNNSEDGLFATTPVQGEIVNLEMNINSKVDIKKIAFHINKAGAYYRSQQELTKAYGSDVNEGLKPTDPSSPCHINALCPQGVDYPNQRKATTRITIINESGAGYCSGTLVNNAAGVCKPYLLTASHCDGENGTTDAHFAQWLFDFNYEYPNCDGTGDPFALKRTIIGANFRARSKFPSTGTGNAAVQDFLLLELKSTPVASWGAYLAGWNINSQVFNDPDMNYFIGFHHPAGDVKKLSWVDEVDPGGTFNQTAVPATHWEMSYNEGFSEGGSSGSGLFDKQGRIIGDLSGGPGSTGACAPAGPQALYSKISRAWVYTFDGPSTSANSLSNWLDPNNTGAITTNTVKIPCETSGIEENEALNNGVLIYPNPSSGNSVTIKTNFVTTPDLSVEIFNIAGQKVGEYMLNKGGTQIYTIDTKELSNGIYMFNVYDKNKSAKISKKVVITR